jgi:ABC-type transport system substrate-binding protein
VSYSPTDQEFVYELADGPPEMQGCELHVTFKKDYTWWDGTPVTAKDRWIAGTIVPYMCCGGPDAVPWNAQLVDDYEFFEVKRGKLNQEFASINMMQVVPTKYDFFNPYVERLEDATTEEEIKDITKEIRDVKITLQDMIDGGFGYGLWQPVDYTSSQITFEKYDDHPKADRTDLEKWVWHVIPEDQSFTQAFKQSRFDYGNSNYTENVQRPPSEIEEVVDYPGRRGRKLGISWRSDHLARRPVRRALGYLLDLEGLATILGTVTPVSQQTAGMPDDLVEKWIGADFLDKLIDYGVESKPERATETLQKAGYERRNGVWRDEDGKRVRGLRFIAPANSDDTLVGNTISEQLNDFGFKNDFSALEGGAYQNIVNPTGGTGEFDLAITQAGPSAPHPSRLWDFKWDSVVATYPQVANIGKPEGCSTEPPTPEWTASETPTFRIPVDPSPQFPEEVGATDLSGPTKEMDPIATSMQMRFDLPAEEIRSLAREWAWWVNFNLFHVYLHSFDRTLWLDTDNFRLNDDATIQGVNYGQGPMGQGDLRTVDR